MKDEDILAGAPRPEPVKPTDAGIQAPNWMGRPILHPSHAEELETHAAINEFGHKQPREHAEQAAYDDYVKRQRTLAAAHHLAGAKAADAAGDKEAARKHGMMYSVHTKALGEEPVGPVPASIQAAGPQKVYKFKAHKGDMFALEQKGPEGVVTSAPPEPTLGKREALYTIWQACQVLAKAQEKYISHDEMTAGRTDNAPRAKVPEGQCGSLYAGHPAVYCKNPKGHDGKHSYTADHMTKKGEMSPRKKSVPCRCTAYSHPHRTGGGKCGAGK